MFKYNMKDSKEKNNFYRCQFHKKMCNCLDPRFNTHNQSELIRPTKINK